MPRQQANREWGRSQREAISKPPAKMREGAVKELATR
jgi:hypothetical protein